LRKPSKRAKTGRRPKSGQVPPAKPDADSPRFAGGGDVFCFLSHATKNRRFAERIQRVLGDHGVDVWLAGDQIIAGQDWLEQVGNALERSDWLLVLLSPAAVKSDWVNLEVKYAIVQERFQGRIILLVYQECELRSSWWGLASVQHVDFQEDFHEGCTQLLAIWGIAYRRQ